MRKWLVFCVLLLSFGLLGVSNAALINKGGGLIYDDVLDITWLQDANYAKTSGYDADGHMTYDEAVAWADQLVYQGYTGWRLPTTVNGDAQSMNWDWKGPDSGDSYDTYSYSYTAGYNLYNSEMGYMFYVTLGNLGYYDTSGTHPQPGYGLNNTGPFINLNTDLYPNYYWSGTQYNYSPTSAAWCFYFDQGYQTTYGKTADMFAWAVHDGELSPIPIPTAVWLLGSGLIGIVSIRRKVKK